MKECVYLQTPVRSAAVAAVYALSVAALCDSSQFFAQIEAGGWFAANRRTVELFLEKDLFRDRKSPLCGLYWPVLKAAF